MKEFKRHLKNAILISFLICLIITLINFMAQGKFTWNMYFLRNNLIGFCYGITLYFVNAYLFLLIGKMFKDDINYRKRMFAFFPLSILTTTVTVFLINLILNVVVYGRSLETFLANQQIGIYVVVITISFLVSLGIFGFNFYQAYKNQQLENQTNIAVNATATFESLKNQLDPHFLFNSLNVLSSLIEEDAKKAQQFTVSLSKVYRYVLEQKDKSLVSIEEEIEFAKLYVSLLEMRFEQALEVNFPDISNKEQFQLIPLSLQLLLENAIKHNVISDSKPLKINLFFQENHLVVENNYQRKETLKQQKGIGLNNIANRYALVSDKQIQIFQSQDYFSVHLPLLTEAQHRYFTNDLLEEEFFNIAYKRMLTLKEWYYSLSALILGIPLWYGLNQVFYPSFQWWLIVIFFMAFGTCINGIKTLNVLGKWERKMINKQFQKK